MMVSRSNGPGVISSLLSDRATVPQPLRPTLPSAPPAAQPCRPRRPPLCMPSAAL